MDTKKVIETLKSLKSSDHSLAFVAENKTQKYSLFAGIVLYFAFIVLTVIKQPIAALICAALSLSVISIYPINTAYHSRKSLADPVGEYIEGLQLGLEREQKVILDLKDFSVETLIEVKENLEFEIKRLNMGVSIFVGAIEKLGLFPSFIALLYGVTKISDESEFISKVLVGFTIGLYIGISQGKRIIAWLNLCVFVLGQTIKSKERGVSTSNKIEQI